MLIDKAKTREPAFTLIDNRTGQNWDFPVLSGSMGPDVIDIRRLYAETGMFTFDPGYTSTAS
ncbi:MAG: citrate (Si)-synthase, partial [Rhodospirillales bacterium]|nr:citrate (Si)-synthase [Rhodospirillales bacterium]